MAAAEALISTVARAFYDDDVVCLIDVLLRDKYLRDDDMSVRLCLPSRQLRKTLQYMESERLVKHELVDDLNMGGSQNTKFWYIDYNHAVHVIRLRVHLLQRRLHDAELQARSSSMYLCPGYKTRMCNGRYNESDAQSIVDDESGLFLCRECVATYSRHPSPPSKSEYTLRLLDNRSEVNRAIEDMRRVRVQFSSKIDVDGIALRQGIFDLIQRVRSATRGGTNNEPLSTNLPSENISMGIGSKRIAGTGRTAGLLIKKQERQGIRQLVSGTDVVGDDRRGTGSGNANNDELTFLRNAIGEEIAFVLERGGGARAHLLATRGRVRDKLIDASAMRVGVDLGSVTRVMLEERDRRNRRRREEERQKEEEREGEGGTKRKKAHGHGGVGELHFLRDNLGIDGTNDSFGMVGGRHRMSSEMADEEEDRMGRKNGGYHYVPDETDEFRNLPEDERRAEWLYWYTRYVQSRRADQTDGTEDVEDVAWEDG